LLQTDNFLINNNLIYTIRFGIAALLKIGFVYESSGFLNASRNNIYLSYVATRGRFNCM